MTSTSSILLSTRKSIFPGNGSKRFLWSWIRQNLSLGLADSIGVVDQHHKRVDHQLRVFDAVADVEESPYPALEQSKMGFLAKKIVTDALEGKNRRSSLKLLDVGCGTGTLFPFVLKAANEEGVTVCMTGIDVSPRMIERATNTANSILKNPKFKHHQIDLFAGDFSTKSFRDNKQKKGSNSNSSKVVWDVAVVNAGFSNFYDSDILMQALRRSLKRRGLVTIMHFAGADYVSGLHERHPETFLHKLPTFEEFQDLCQKHELKFHDFVDDFDGHQIYYASARKEKR